MAANPAALWPRPLLPGLAALLLAGFCGLYAADPEVCHRVLICMGVRAWNTPFIDLEGVTAQIRCARLGVDVYASNPCDSLGRVFDYAPLWLRLGFLGLGHEWTGVLGLAQAALCILALLALPVPKAGWALACMLAAIASPVVAFAIERANQDGLIFALTAASLVLLRHRLPARLAGYGLIALAASLKFYPAILALLVLRERRAVMLGVGAAFAVLGLGFMAAYHVELARAVANVPVPSPFSLSFGASLLPRGMRALTGWPAARPAAWLALLAATLTASRWLARQPDFRRALAALPPESADALRAGAVLVCGCFVAGPSIGYRGIFLLFTVPGIARIASLAGGAAWFGIIAVLMVMWLPLPMHFFDPGEAAGAREAAPAFLALWLLREVLWWGLIAVLLAAAGRTLSAEWRV